MTMLVEKERAAILIVKCTKVKRYASIPGSKITISKREIEVD